MANHVHDKCTLCDAKVSASEGNRIYYNISSDELRCVILCGCQPSENIPEK